MYSLTRQTFLEKAEDRLADIRGSLLLFAQGRLSAGDLAPARRKLDELRTEAQSGELVDAVRLASECSDSIELLALANSPNHDRPVNRALDLLSRLEAELLQMPLGSADFLADINAFVDSSFENFSGNHPAVREFVQTPDSHDEDFEVDDETLEIFRSEAEELLANILSNLKILSRSPDDNNALWEIRRNAHTFKGAAGIIGFREASKLAHRIEDLLDKMVESRCGADGRVIELLTTSTARLADMTTGKDFNEDPKTAADLAADFDILFTSVPAYPGESAALNQSLRPVAAYQDSVTKDSVKSGASSPTPIVRVSLDRLDDLLKVSRSLLVNRSSLAKSFGELTSGIDSLQALADLIETQRRLSDEMLHKLLQIRMVRFGTLEMRLNRAVHVTCQEESKKAFVVIENPDVEIDTQVIDALIEPLLHLLKNAVVHGIEPPDTRRLLGKPEKGRICITVDSDNDGVFLSVGDDGRGISISKLLEKAIAGGIIAPEKVASVDEQTIRNLIFHRGLTTADSLNLNAGRGIGMSIVKESVEGRGGSIAVESEQQKGTKFTIRMPLTLPKSTDHYPQIKSIGTGSTPAADASPLVLIVDDSQSIRRMTAKIVEDAGWRAITAVDGADALELLLSGAWRPDLILTDVEMPTMDGWAFLEYVKTDDIFGHIPVVMVTSLDSDEFRQKALGLGASDYLVKPFRIAELDQILADLGKVNAV